MEKEGIKNDSLQWQFLGVVVGSSTSRIGYNPVSTTVELRIYITQLFGEPILGVEYRDKIYLSYEKGEGSYYYSFEVGACMIRFKVPKNLAKAVRLLTD